MANVAPARASGGTRAVRREPLVSTVDTKGRERGGARRVVSLLLTLVFQLIIFPQSRMIRPSLASMLVGITMLGMSLKTVPAEGSKDPTRNPGNAIFNKTGVFVNDATAFPASRYQSKLKSGQRGLDCFANR